MRNKNPEITALSLALPAALINIEIGGFGKALACFFRRGLEHGAEQVDAVAHGSNAQIQAEEGVHDLHDPPSANPMY